MAEVQGSGPTARRIVLGAQLRRLRERCEITRADAGYHIRGSESKISRMELGRVGFKERDIADLLTLYGVDDATEREQFLDLVRQAGEPGWWHRYSDLMQTEEYARAIVSQGRPDLATAETERLVALRMSRQNVLQSLTAPKLWAVIDESVLHRPIGGARVLREQIDHLLELTRLPNVTLQVVPYALSGYAAEGSFSMLRFNEPELPDLVYLEHLGGAAYLDRPEEIERYSRVVDRLMVDAETPNDTRQFLVKRRDEI